MTICTNCGQSLPANVGFCTACGAPVGAAADAGDDAATRVLPPGDDQMPTRRPRLRAPTSNRHRCSRLRVRRRPR